LKTVQDRQPCRQTDGQTDIQSVCLHNYNQRSGTTYWRHWRHTNATDITL